MAEREFKLIKDGQLDIESFKEIFGKISWIRAPRKLTEKHTDYWYIGKYEDLKKKDRLLVKVSPTKWMRVVETQIGAHKVNKGYKDWSASAEVRVGDVLMTKIKEASKEPPKHEMQEVDW